jgi:serine/threonine protein kinase
VGRPGHSSTMIEAETAVGPRRPGAPAETLPARVGRYRVLGLLGEGAIGRVYRAVAPDSGHEVAVKRVHRALGTDPRVMERFRREAETVERLTHPNLVSVHDVGDDFLVLDLVEGEGLDRRLEREGALSPREALPLLRQVADALDYIHARGIVHRDVKPSNVLVTPDGTVKLADFGIAHLSWAPITRTGELIGSPAYMAPEQVALGEVEPASDVHALGVVAFQCLTGERPFKGRGVGSLLQNVVYQQAPAASSLQPDLPGAVDPVLARALAKDPDERFACARDFIDALAAALSPPTPPPTGRGRGPSWLGAVGAALLAAV